MYPLAAEATDLYEGARGRIASWLGSTPEETIFTANATAAINMVAYTWGRQNVQRGDLVVLTEMEHHSNIVPWQLLCQDREAELAYVPVSSRTGCWIWRRSMRCSRGVLDWWRSCTCRTCSGP